MSKKLYIFDLDGVLVNTSHIHTAALRQAVFELVGYDASREPYLDAIDGYSTKDKLQELDMYFELGDEKLALIDARKRELTILGLQTIERSPLADYLPTIIQHGKIFALASNSRREFVDIIVRKLGMEGYFHTIIAGDEVANHKPHPEMFIKIMHRLGMFASQTIVFEDSPAGIQAAEHAGVSKIVKVDPLRLLQISDFLH